MAQCTLLCFFEYKTTAAKWGAFKRMGRPPLSGLEIPGLEFWKTLGVGGAAGFSLRPDFSTYALLLVFEDEANAEAFTKSAVMEEYSGDAHRKSLIFMHTISSHGEWSGKVPFENSIEQDPEKMLAVITRATIKPRLAFKFWRNVPPVAKSMENFPGNIFAKGIGEWPVFMQATFSIWKNFEVMKNYAYRNPAHAEMIKKTRDLGWYREELFARFHPYRFEGDLISFPH